MNLANLASPAPAAPTTDAGGVALPADARAATPTDPASPPAPAAGFQQALQQACDDADTPAETDPSEAAQALARWLNAPMIPPPEAVSASDAPASAPDPAQDSPADPASTQDSPALRPDWTQLPAALGATLAGQTTPRTAAGEAGPVPRSLSAPSRGGIARSTLPGDSTRPVPPQQAPSAAGPDTLGTAAAHAMPAVQPAPAAHAAFTAAAAALAQPLDGADDGTASATPPLAAPALATPVAGDASLTAAGTAVPATSAGEGPGPLRAHSPQALRVALGERLSWQVDQRSEQATIRLSPERLGHIDIQIRHEAGGLQVQLAASHGEVLRQLQQVSDGLRQDLGQRHGGEISVQVAERRDNAGLGDGSSRQQPGRPREEQQPGRALAEADEGDGARFALA